MITDNDVKKLKTIFATKDDLALATVGLVHVTELDKKLEALESRIDKKFDRIINTLDGMLGEMQTYREEQTVGGNLLSEHEDRLEIIENKLQIA